MASFDLATGQQVFPGHNGYPRSLVEADDNNFAPRLGLAWRASDRMTLRTGYGIFYTPDVINTYRQLAFQQPFGAVSSITARPADPQNPLPVFTADDPLTQATRLATNNRNGIERNLRDGRVQQWNTSVQYLLTNRTLVEVAYHGANSVHLMSGLNYNETDPFPPQPPDYQLIYPYPQLGNVNIYGSRARSNYNALQARLERRLANGFSGLVSYTWQQTLTDLDTSSVGAAFGAGAGLQTIKDIGANYGPAVFDRPHRLVVTWLYELPFFQQRHDLLGKVAGAGKSGRLARSRTGPLSHPPRSGSLSPDRTPIYSAIQTCRALNERSIDGSTSASSPIRRRVSLAMPAKA